MSDLRWIRRKRKEATADFSMSTRTVYYKVLQEFTGRRWVDVETVDESDEDIMFPAKQIETSDRG